MKSRQEIKAIGKAEFKANYWNCVLALLLVGAVLCLLNGASYTKNVKDIVEGNVLQTAYESGTSISVKLGGLLYLLLSGPLDIGLNYFFVKNVQRRRDGLTATTPFVQAFQNYPRKLGGSLWMSLFIFLWSLLFMIPGIIKAFSYSMTPYILADCPDVKAQDALKLSMRMMKGHKGEYFVLILSFIGWGILTVLTAGLVGVFYAGPYLQSTLAAYYLEVREQALRTGAVRAEQLAGVMPA